MLQDGKAISCYDTHPLLEFPHSFPGCQALILHFHSEFQSPHPTTAVTASEMTGNGCGLSSLSHKQRKVNLDDSEIPSVTTQIAPDQKDNSLYGGGCGETGPLLHGW